ncbi:MAG TPA: glycosyltransferase family 4 protein [Solirubrobacterales bacterium]|nr:glycosyltransferase family 4 protein [Solirubrobacterales bacterium]
MASGAREVLVVLHEHTLGGASQSVLRVAPKLEERGWRFAFWVPRPSPLHDDLMGRGLEVAGAPRHIDFGLRALLAPPGAFRRAASWAPYLRDFRRFVRARRPELVHANSVTTVVEGLAGRRSGAATLMHCHEVVPRGLRGAAIRRSAWTRLDGVAAVSGASADTLAWKGRRPAVVYEAAPIPPHPVAIRDRPSPFRIGMVGAVSRRKGSDVLVDAAERLLASGDDIQIEIVGAPEPGRDAGWAERVLARARAAGVTHTERADVAERMGRWDGFVLPSRRDPCPIAMLEAMAAGLPVIGAAVDGIPEQIAPGCGFLVEADAPLHLAAAIRRIAALGAPERARMGRGARARVAAEFSLDRQAAGLEAAYEAALRASWERRS